MGWGYLGRFKACGVGRYMEPRQDFSPFCVRHVFFSSVLLVLIYSDLILKCRAGRKCRPYLIWGVGLNPPRYQYQVGCHAGYGFKFLATLMLVLLSSRCFFFEFLQPGSGKRGTQFQAK